MEQQFITLTNKKIAEHFQAIKDLLFQKESYQTTIDTKNVSLYFNFLEACLKQPYNRVFSTSNFIDSQEGQLTDQMYPFALLKPAIKEQIRAKCTSTINLANGLDVSGIDPDFQLLGQERFMKDIKIEK